MKLRTLCVVLTVLVAACERAPEYDVILRHGTIYNGTGDAGVTGDVAILGDTIAA